MGLFIILFNKWTVLIIGIVFMFIGLLPEYTLKAVRMIGMMGWAEQRLGRGGTFSVWKIIGILAPIGAIIYFFTPSIQFKGFVDKTQTQSQDPGYEEYFDNSNNLGY
jgi:hypothetical protein